MCVQGWKVGMIRAGEEGLMGIEEVNAPRRQPPWWLLLHTNHFAGLQSSVIWLDPSPDAAVKVFYRWD